MNAIFTLDNHHLLVGSKIAWRTLRINIVYKYYF